MTQQEIDQIKARQRLLDAAPKLLEACEALLKAQGGEWDRGNVYITRALADEMNAAAKACRVAISLARGEK